MSQIAAAGLDSQIQRSTTSGFEDLGSEEFLQIIFTELTNQDPLAPNDTKALLDQLNTIRSIESDLQLTRRLESIVTENQLSTAGSLIGKVVTGRDDGFGRAEGVVVAVARAGDSISLELADGTRVPMDNVEEIFDPSLLGRG